MCIDQADMEELGEQVRMMWDIYRAAECVMVWLGPEEGDSATAMDNFAQQQTHTRLVARRTKWNNGPVPGSSRCRCPAGDFENHPPSSGVHNLLTRRWFSRVWISQSYAITMATMLEVLTTRPGSPGSCGGKTRRRSLRQQNDQW